MNITTKSVDNSNNTKETYRGDFTKENSVKNINMSGFLTSSHKLYIYIPQFERHFFFYQNHFSILYRIIAILWKLGGVGHNLYFV